VLATRPVNTPPTLQEFILRHTTPATPPLVPELTLQLSVGAIALWEALEAHTGLRNLPPPYWAFAWPGGQALARHVLDHPELVRGKGVLDFAAGGGIQAIAAARAGAARLVATEIDAYATEAMQLNAALNGVSFEVSAEDVIDRDLGWDVVLAGDVCYERPMAERVERWLAGLARRGALVLMGDPGRNYLPRRGLAEVARHVVPTTRDLEDRESRTTVVWRFTGS
jgi:predicted nicotinamide N-methyase